MTWIRTIPFDEDETLRKAREAQQALYPHRVRASRRTRTTRTTDGIVGSHSLIPDALYHAFAAFGALMSPDLPLSRRQHEMITTVVSAIEPVPVLTGVARRVSA